MLRFSLKIAFILPLLTLTSLADVRLPNILGSNMVLQRDKPINIWGWAEASEKVTVSFNGHEASTTADKDGKWSLQLPRQSANAKPQSLTVTGKNKVVLENILIGEVWLCSGQSNMQWAMTRTKHKAEEIPKSDHPSIRLFAIKTRKSNKPAEDTPHKWTACNPKTVPGFSGVGYHFGRSLLEQLDVPIGLIQSAWGGTQIEPWTPKVGLDQVASLSGENGGIYNGMIHPLAPLTMRGIIWYQGESNCLKGDTDIYTDRTLALVKGWRHVFKQDDLPFYFVQIAPFTYVKAFKKRNKNLDEFSLPKFWDAQAACLKALPNSGMVVVTDITGNVRDIHPSNKRDVGARLARWALAKNYGKSDVVYSGPVFKSMKVEGGKTILQFDHVGSGLTSLDDKPLNQFSVAGADKVFKPATATIQGKSVVLASPEVATPVAVRFAWHETAVGNLGNQEGLPAVQFRTDDW